MPKKKVYYYKLTENVTLSDGMTIKKDEIVRFNYKEGPFLNVEFLADKDIKRSFWVTDDQCVKAKSKNEVWDKKMIEEHDQDLNETWFQRSTKEVKKKVKKLLENE